MKCKPKIGWMDGWVDGWMGGWMAFKTHF